MGPVTEANIQNSTLRSDGAGRDGAGIYLATTDSAHSVGNSIIHDNTADSGRGGGVFIDSVADSAAVGELRLINTTIAFNGANLGGGGYVGVETSPNMVRDLWNSIVYENSSGSGAADLFLEGAPSGLVHEFGIDHSFLGQRTLGTNASILLRNSTSLGFIDAVATGFKPVWENGQARDFRLSALSVCLDQGNDNLLGFDFVDIDDDLVTVGERYPREFRMIDEPAQTSTSTTREIAAGVVNNIPDIGVNSLNTPFAAICDIGAFERRMLFDSGESQ